jgi:hypothetical protein
MKRKEELEELRRKLNARQGRPGLEENVMAIEARIADLEAKDAD